MEDHADDESNSLRPADRNSSFVMSEASLYETKPRDDAVEIMQNLNERIAKHQKMQVSTQAAQVPVQSPAFMVREGLLKPVPDPDIGTAGEDLDMEIVHGQDRAALLNAYFADEFNFSFTSLEADPSALMPHSDGGELIPSVYIHDYIADDAKERSSTTCVANRTNVATTEIGSKKEATAHVSLQAEGGRDTSVRRKDAGASDFSNHSQATIVSEASSRNESVSNSAAVYSFYSPPLTKLKQTDYGKERDILANTIVPDAVNSRVQTGMIGSEGITWPREVESLWSREEEPLDDLMQEDAAPECSYYTDNGELVKSTDVFGPNPVFSHKKQATDNGELMKPNPVYPHKKQARRFSMPTFSSGSIQEIRSNSHTCVQEEGDNSQAHPWFTEDEALLASHKQQHLQSAYSYDVGNGELVSSSNAFGSEPVVSRKRQARRFSMPARSTPLYDQSLRRPDTSQSQSYVSQEQQQSGLPDFPVGADPTVFSGRRQVRRFSLSPSINMTSSIHEHAAHEVSMSLPMHEQTVREVATTSTSIHEHAVHDVSNSMSAGEAQTAQSAYVNATDLGAMGYGGGLHQAVYPLKKQERRLSMPTLSSNAHDDYTMSAPSPLLWPFLQPTRIAVNTYPSSLGSQAERCVDPATSHAREQQPEERASVKNVIRIVLHADRALATEFSFSVLSEAESCTFEAVDRTGKRRGLSLGFQGLACRHCQGLGKIGGRLFPSTIKTMSDTNKTLLAMYNHLIKCRKCPGETKEALLSLRGGHEEERKLKKYGSQKALFSMIWKRLHGENPPQQMMERRFSNGV